VADLDQAPPHDPWEKTNRGIFAFDTAVDRHALGPVAHAYAAVIPRVVRHHITLVLANMDEPITTANQLFQLHFNKFGRSLARFTFNSTIGIGGIFDFASHHGLPHEGADFGQTLGRWGVKSGPYVVLPLLGPASVRDSFGRAVDLVGDPVSWVLGDFLSTFGASREGGEVVDGRVQADQALKAVYDSTDPYAAARSGYMQAREADVRAATGKAEVLPDFGEP
jgi:phospholipid-binding lipoprotein MlaA